ncbi:MAG: caspase domain-containing protein [Campylobacterales bacterium]
MFIKSLTLFAVVFASFLFAEDGKSGQTEVGTTGQSVNPRIQRRIDLLKKPTDGQNTATSATSTEQPIVQKTFQAVTPKPQILKDELLALLSSANAAPKDPKTWLLAIAVEKYDSTSPVVYSAKSGEAFVATAEKLLGIPKENIVFLRDDKATTGAVKDAVLKISERAEPGDTIYFYYSGHGIPDPTSSEAFILPKDKSVEYVGKEPDLKMRQIYQTLEKSKAAKVVAIVDACFSGMTDGTAVYKGVAAAHFKPKAYIPTPKMVILTAGKDTQFSNSFDEKKHRMFSYYLMKSIIDGRKELVDIYQEVRLKVKDESRKKGGSYEQEPQMIGNSKLKL